jgi:predicted dehydrogenase
MRQPISRRQFLGRSAVATAAAAVWSRPLHSQEKSHNERLDIACIGAGNKGWHNIEQLQSQNIVALCDVDANFLGEAAKRFPEAARYRDYRRLFDKEHNRFDAVVVSTADHNHAVATTLALSLGKHVYCEKPLTHTVEEARVVARLAAEKKVATQMGTQIHAESNYRRVVELIQSGAIGAVREVYNWCNKGWSDGRFRSAGVPAPPHLDWDLWLGPAGERPYSPNIHPADWRRFWEYGSGTFGDMAAHIMDLPFWALGLRHPERIVARGPEVHPDGAPAWVMASYDFPVRGEQPPLKFYWSDGGKHHDLVRETKDKSGKPLGSWGLGVLFKGDKGMLAAHYGGYELLPQEQFEGFQPPPRTIPDSIGHWKEWVKAAKTGSPTTCNFDYSGALTETILLGIVAFRTGETIEWDAKNLKVTNCPKAAGYLTKEYRKGWELERG